MNHVEIDGRLRSAILRWQRGVAPLLMREVAPLPVTLPDGRTIAFGDLSPEQLELVADALRERADRDHAAVESEWAEEE